MHQLLYFVMQIQKRHCLSITNTDRKYLTGDPDVVQFRRLLCNFSGECPQSELQLLPVEWMLHAHLLKSEKEVNSQKGQNILKIIPFFGGIY